MSFDWSYGPTREDWSCETIAVEEDTYFSAFRLTGAMPGTFRAILSVEDEPAQTGEYLCPNAGAVPGERFLFAAGWGEDDQVVMPEGTAMKVEAGKYLTLWVHIVNQSTGELDGDTGIEVQTMPVAEVAHQAGMFMLGTWTIDVPSDGQPHQAVAFCSLPAPWTFFAFAPHMHRLGVHSELRFSPGVGDETILLDERYDVDDHKHYPDDLTVVVNDQLWLTCSYRNNTGLDTIQGASFLSEQCLTALYHYEWNDAATPYFCAPM